MCTHMHVHTCCMLRATSWRIAVLDKCTHIGICICCVLLLYIRKRATILSQKKLYTSAKEPYTSAKGPLYVQ